VGEPLGGGRLVAPRRIFGALPGFIESMDKRRPIQPRIDAGRDDDGSVSADRFREALARWAATVTLVAARDDRDRVHATTVSSFAPLSAEPPLVVVCLGPTAQVLPYATEGDAVGVSLLPEGESRWATIYADAFAVRTPEWSAGGAPLLPSAVAGLRCTVQAVHSAEGGSRVLVCGVDDIELGDEDRPLLYWERGYRRLDRE
jgi:flavin reductase (DIM6/NTAB) family NADH-FMN oxidoreductase RutF